jgi:hypothetical protein
VIYLEVCRSPPGAPPTLRLVPDTEEPHLLCHRLFKWPIQGKVPLVSFGSAGEAFTAAIAAGYSGDPLQLLDLLGDALLP